MKVLLASPQVCIVCKRNACYEELPVCSRCINEMQNVIVSRCRICGKSAFDCKCREGENLRFLFYYTDNYANHSLIYYIKNDSDEKLMDFFAEALIGAKGINISRYDGVTFVPRLPSRKRIYGHDQAEQLANAISRRYGIPTLYLLKRAGGNQQKMLTAKERFLHIKGKFSLKDGYTDKQYNKLLLVDDLSTTGATINACAEILHGVAKSVTKAVLVKTSFKD